VPPLFPKVSKMTKSIIGAAIEMHRDKGPGLIESIYEWCMMRELRVAWPDCHESEVRPSFV